MPEEQLGVSLFARERHRLVGLTSADAEFLAEARRILDEVEEAIRRAQRVALGRSGRLQIGLTSDAATLHLSEILAVFHAHLSKALVEPVELSGSKALPALRANTIDLALACERENTCGFAVEELWRESWSVILPEGHPLCRKRAIAPADPAGEALALVRSSAQKRVLARMPNLQKELGGRRIAFRVCKRRTAIMLARAGSAIALAPSLSTWLAALRAAVQPLFRDPGYAVIALQHDIDPPPGLIEWVFSMWFQNLWGALLEGSARLCRCRPGRTRSVVRDISMRPHKSALGFNEQLKDVRDDAFDGDRLAIA